MSWVGISSSILFPSGLLILDFGRWIFDLGLNIDTILAKQSSRTFFWKIKGKQEKRPSRLLCEYSIYYNISRTIWMIKSLRIVTYVLWLLTCSFMYCTMLCNFETSIWYS